MNRVSVNQCAQCGADIIAAEWSEHLSESCVRNVWACDACGYQFEDTVYLSRQVHRGGSCCCDGSDRQGAVDNQSQGAGWAQV